MLAACNEDDTSLYYDVQPFAVGQVVWDASVSTSDREVISDLLDHMVKVEACNFWMGGQAKSYKRANYFSSYGSTPDTIWDASVATLPDTLYRYRHTYNEKGVRISTRRDTLPYVAVYKYLGLPVGPVVEVQMPDYYIGQYEITQRQWLAVMGEGNYPEGIYCKFPEVPRDSAWYAVQGKGDNIPAYNVSYEDAQRFCATLSAKTGLEVRIPTEAEWECAARGGKYSRGYKFAGSDNVTDVAWVYSNAANQNRDDSLRYGPRPVGEQQANELALYDMTGNVSEWVSNSYYQYTNHTSNLVNPQGPSTLGDTLILRGGSWVQRNTADYGLASRKKFIRSSYSKDETQKTGSFYDAIANCGIRIVITAK